PVDQYAKQPNTADPQRMWTVDTRAVTGTHHDFRARQVNSRGQVVPPGEHARRESRVVDELAAGGANFHTHARLAADGITQAAVMWDGDRGRCVAPLMDGDEGVERVAERVRQVCACDREDANAPASLGLRLDRIGAD